MKSKTIARNRKTFINQLFNRAINCKCYSLDNGFTGESIEATALEAKYNRFVKDKLIQLADGTYQVRCHSNLWYTFEVKADLVNAQSLVAVHSDPEMQVHPEIESQDVPEDVSLNPEQVMVLEADLEIASRHETPAEATQDVTHTTAADEVMLPQERLADSSAQLREGIVQDDEMGQMLAEGLKEIARSHEAKPKTKKRVCSKKDIYIAPNPIAKKQIKPGTKAATEIELLRKGATKEEVMQALGWKAWSHGRSVALEYGYGIRRDEQGKFWLVEPETLAVAS